MAEIDGFELLVAIGKNPAQFRFVKIDVNKSARAWFLKALKQDGLTLDQTKELRKIAGENFKRIVGALSIKELRSIIKKIDEFYSGLKTSDQTTLFDHVIALADNEVHPAAASPKPEKQRKTKVSPKKSAERLDSAVAAQIGKDDGDLPDKATRKNKPRSGKRKA